MKRLIPILIIAWLIQPLIMVGTPKFNTTESYPFVSDSQVKLAQPIHTDLKPQAVLEAVYVAPPASVPSTYTKGGNSYRDYIFDKESTNNPAAINGGGCIGLGQDCNLWMVRGHMDAPVCPNWKTDVSCQLRYWDWYANTIYGGWANAYAFRSSHNYW